MNTGLSTTFPRSNLGPAKVPFVSTSWSRTPVDPQITAGADMLDEITHDWDLPRRPGIPDLAPAEKCGRSTCEPPRGPVRADPFSPQVSSGLWKMVKSQAVASSGAKVG